MAKSTKTSPVPKPRAAPIRAAAARDKLPADSSPFVPDPVVAQAPGSTVIAWVDKDHWKDGKPSRRVPVYFLDMRIRGLPHYELMGISANGIEALGQALLGVAKIMKDPQSAGKMPRYREA